MRARKSLLPRRNCMNLVACFAAYKPVLPDSEGTNLPKRKSTAARFMPQYCARTRDGKREVSWFRGAKGSLPLSAPETDGQELDSHPAGILSRAAQEASCI